MLRFLPDRPAELTEVRIDATLSGDYRPLVQFINSIERDKLFFVINTVTLNGQQSGTVNLRLGMKTYEQGAAAQDQHVRSGRDRGRGKWRA